MVSFELSDAEKQLLVSNGKISELSLVPALSEIKMSLLSKLAGKPKYTP
jgi:hypothetical protein